jgi:glycerol-3-phosphate dehydrogenase
MSEPDFSFQTRRNDLSRLQSEIFDIAVVGGGVTGAAVARDATLRGLKVILLEANDFASGTSSGSSKLLHGGIRYLEQYEFGLVRHAIQEREKLEKLYAPLVKDLDFVFPTYKRRYPPRWQLNLGLHLYDAFSGFRVRHKNLSAAETHHQFPWLKTEALSGACVYTDSFAEDFRIVVELIKSAHRHSALCFSRLKVKDISKENEFNALEVEDKLAANSFYKIKSRFVFNCAGPFSDELRKTLNLEEALKLTQGVHFLIPHEKLPIRSAFVMTDPKQHRILFAIPWKSTTYLGTTDTSIEKPEDARATKTDLDYVLSIVNKYFQVQIERKDVFQSWAAVRPLLRPGKKESNSQISREHKIEENPQSIFHILGGKLTSHRLMAEEALDLLTNKIPMKKCQTGIVPLEVATEFENLELEKKIKYSIHHEMALRPLDFIRRRSTLYYEKPTQEMAKSVTDVFARELSYSSSERENALQEVLSSFLHDQSF